MMLHMDGLVWQSTLHNEYNSFFFVFQCKVCDLVRILLTKIMTEKISLYEVGAYHVWSLPVNCIKPDKQFITLLYLFKRWWHLSFRKSYFSLPRGIILPNDDKQTQWYKKWLAGKANLSVRSCYWCQKTEIWLSNLVYLFWWLYLVFTM